MKAGGYGVPGPLHSRDQPGPGSVKYERSWGIEESLEQFQGLVRQHPGGGSGEGVKSWVFLQYACFPNIVTMDRMIIQAYIVRLSNIIYA